LVAHVTDLARFFDERPELHRSSIDHACENYFVDV
jgi:hypothetical protein